MLNGALAAISCAKPKVTASSSATGTTRLIRPSRSARIASKGWAVKIISLARRKPAALRSVEEGEHAAGIVGHAKLGRGDREGGALGGDDQVAGEHSLGGPAPDAALDHRDHRPREALDLAHQPAQGIVPAERVAARLGQLVDVVAGGEHLGAGWGAQDHHPRLDLAKALQRGDELLHEGMAQRVAPALVVEGDGGDGVGQLGKDMGHEPLLQRGLGIKA